MGWLERFGEGWAQAGETAAKLPPLAWKKPRAGTCAPAHAPAMGNDVAPAAPSSTSLADELDECRRVILDLTDAVEREKTRAEAFGAALRLPGVKATLVKGHHDDTHRNASAADRERIGQGMRIINAAYGLLEENT